jgi:hypothetical protein
MSGSQTDASEKRKSFEHTFHPAHVVAGISKNPTLKQGRDLLEHGAAWAHRLKNTATFANYAGLLGKGGDALQGATKAIDNAISKGNSFVHDAGSLVKVGEALSVLNKYKEDIRQAPIEVGEAADKLFKEAGSWLGKLPPPFNIYSKTLTEMFKDGGLFANVAKASHPDQDPQSSQYDAWRSVDDKRK